jgi:hypothetical protein
MLGADGSYVLLVLQPIRGRASSVNETRRLEFVLVSGERRTVSVAGQMPSIATVLERLDDWIETDDGTWVQKRFVVEVRLEESASAPRAGSDLEDERLDQAAGELAIEAGAIAADDER